MRLLILGALAVGLAGAFPPSVLSAWDEEDVAGIAKMLADGTAFLESGKYPVGHLQWIGFSAKKVWYLVDFRAQLCFSRGAKGRTVFLVPCEAIKRGYPLFTPLITWVK